MYFTAILAQFFNTQTRGVRPFPLLWPFVAMPCCSCLVDVKDSQMAKSCVCCTVNSKYKRDEVYSRDIV